MHVNTYSGCKCVDVSMYEHMKVHTYTHKHTNITPKYTRTHTYTRLIPDPRNALAYTYISVNVIGTPTYDIIEIALPNC
jgi:hypothetical protein